MKVYHQPGAQIIQSDQNVEYIFCENNNYHQMGNALLELDITVRKNDTTSFHNDNPIRLVNNPYAFFQKSSLKYYYW